MIKQFTMQNIRCFDGRHDLRIRPLTFFVGENSTGKTTTLGCYQTLLSVLGDGRTLDFNVEPYAMGAFADIVRKISGGKTPEDEFTFGINVQLGHADKLELGLFLTIHDEVYGAAIKALTIIFPDATGSITIQSEETIDLERYENNFIIKIFPDFIQDFINFFLNLLNEVNFIFALTGFINQLSRQHASPRPHATPQPPVIEELYEFIKQNLYAKLGAKREKYILKKFPLKGVKSLAPVRSKPQRIYEPLAEIPTSEGNEVPIYMARLARTDKTEWERLRGQLKAFGKTSGLFDDIRVKRYSRERDPFQLSVKVRGQESALNDVGYGIGQILPILVSVFRNEKPQTLLIQQPEVHLHARVQATLASLLIDSIAKPGNRFIIETHSDYMIDRTCIEIRRGNIKPEDVSIIYFEPSKNAVETHNIRFDEKGELVDAPQGYRDFFLKEGGRLLGFED